MVRHLNMREVAEGLSLPRCHRDHLCVSFLSRVAQSCQAFLGVIPSESEVTLPAQRAGLRQPSLSEELRLIGCLLVVVPTDVPFDEVGGDVVSHGAHRVAVLPQLAGPVPSAQPGACVERTAYRCASGCPRPARWSISGGLRGIHGRGPLPPPPPRSRTRTPPQS